MEGRGKGQKGSLGCIFFGLLMLVAMPLVGIYMIFKYKGSDKLIGVFVMLAGIGLWVYYGFMMVE